MGGDGEVELDAVAGEDVVDDGEGCGGGVAFGGEVGEVDVGKAWVEEGAEQFAALGVGEMAVAAEDALFIDHWSCTCHHHVRFMVGL